MLRALCSVDQLFLQSTSHSIMILFADSTLTQQQGLMLCLSWKRLFSCRDLKLYGMLYMM